MLLWLSFAVKSVIPIENFRTSEMICPVCWQNLPTIRRIIMLSSSESSRTRTVLLNCLTINMKELRTFETSVTKIQPTKCNISLDLNLQ